MLFQDLGSRRVEADFSGGHLSSDGGALLLSQIDNGLGVIRTLATCFSDGRDGRFIEHSIAELLAQRIHALALGYEDLNDHDSLRRDPLLAVAAGKSDPLGSKRSAADKGKALASPATLNRLELGNNKSTCAHKIGHDPEAIERTLLEMGVRALKAKSREIILDFDASDDPLHGHQEGRFFHGYYGGYCYLPLYCFAGDVILWAELRTSDRDGSDGTLEALQKIVRALRRRFPKVRIIVRGDSGFCREPLMAWCEAQKNIYYCFGLARNSRLQALLLPALDRARQRALLCGGVSVRDFSELDYRTLNTWSRARRVVGKAEVTAQGDNPRFIVTNLPEGDFETTSAFKSEGRFGARRLYEEVYCGRGDMENKVKQMQLDLVATRMSSHWMASNQLRLWFSAFAYLLLERLRALTLGGSVLAKATLGSVRLRLLKVGAQIKVSVRRIYIQLASAYPLQSLFRRCQGVLGQMATAAG
jgi:hypothetical protein